MRKTIYEVLHSTNDQSDPMEVAKILKSNDSPVLRLVLLHNFDPSIKYKLPEGRPPFKNKNDVIGFADSNLYTEARRMSYLWHNPPPAMSKRQLESLFIGLLESLDSSEAEVMLAVKDKILTEAWPNVTENATRLAFPDLLPPAIAIDPESIEQTTTKLPRKTKSTKPRKLKTESKTDPKKNG